MRPERVLQVGIVGSVVAAICCFTPALVVLLAALAIFLATIGYGLWLRHLSTRS